LFADTNHNHQGERSRCICFLRGTEEQEFWRKEGEKPTGVRKKRKWEKNENYFAIWKSEERLKIQMKNSKLKLKLGAIPLFRLA